LDRFGFRSLQWRSRWPVEGRVWVADARRDGTFVRVTWHQEDRLFVVIHWRNEVCIAATDTGERSS
jgi:hypothetical protein